MALSFYTILLSLISKLQTFNFIEKKIGVMNDIISRAIRRSIALKQSMGPCHTRRADLTGFKSISPVFTVIRSIIQVTHLIVNARKISFGISRSFPERL